ncbi:hypothetical protein FGO68_gene6153 [Halteria grandinella]|uniref:Uncharacterized protein n=1 Tax=Halteria grandinella TaxID=5974 RepID=A0A8J8NE87_HALGN|nr:hypothetical protein FGO68_gene6153 [Halteria grandinella]
MPMRAIRPSCHCPTVSLSQTVLSKLPLQTEALVCMIINVQYKNWTISFAASSQVPQMKGYTVTMNEIAARDVIYRTINWRIHWPLKKTNPHALMRILHSFSISQRGAIQWCPHFFSNLRFSNRCQHHFLSAHGSNTQ